MLSVCGSRSVRPLYPNEGHGRRASGRHTLSSFASWVCCVGRWNQLAPSGGRTPPPLGRSGLRRAPRLSSVSPVRQVPGGSGTARRPARSSAGGPVCRGRCPPPSGVGWSPRRASGRAAASGGERRTAAGEPAASGGERRAAGERRRASRRPAAANGERQASGGGRAAAGERLASGGGRTANAGRMRPRRRPTGRSPPGHASSSWVTLNRPDPAHTLCA